MIKHMTTMNETIALLSGMAPKEPEQWAVDEWMDGFKKDYPEPWWPKGGGELNEANAATVCASAGVDSMSMTGLMIATCHKDAKDLLGTIFGKSFGEHAAWGNWMEECRKEWEANSWPIIWARKRMELVNETSKG